MRKIIIATGIFGLFLYGYGCTTTTSFREAERQIDSPKIIVSTADLKKEYKILGPVKIRMTNPLFSTSMSDLDEFLRKKARKQYDDIDAIINVRYSTVSFAEGILDKEIGKNAEGVAVKFIDRKEDMNDSTSRNWDQIKRKAQLYVAFPKEYETPYRQKLSILGWEDGVHISRDGLNLYCLYAPADVLSYILHKAAQDKLNIYKRGPDFGMDLVTGPLGPSPTGWMHADILYSHRDSSSEPFSSWRLSGMARPVFTEGAPNPLFKDPKNIELMLFTSQDNPTYNTDMWVIHNTKANPSGKGKPLPYPVNTNYNEDNPHLERIDGDNLVLFFDSDNRPGSGSHDVWYNLSINNGKTWSEPVNVTSVNTKEQDHQPHLFRDKKGRWYLYFSAMNSDGKLAIFRARQSIPGDWNSWVEKELVIGAGNTAGVGEPTLTEQGDISFVVVYANPNGTDTDRFDADPWFLPIKK